jgi:AbrB family looped-hinge helix DNA binding protein
MTGGRARPAVDDTTVKHVPTESGNMAKVDSKGRIVLPQELRDRLGISPGTEVEVREEDGRAVIEPEADPEEIVERMERLVAEASANRDAEPTPEAEMHPIARKHAERIRRGAGRGADADE